MLNYARYELVSNAAVTLSDVHTPTLNNHYMKSPLMQDWRTNCATASSDIEVRMVLSNLRKFQSWFHCNGVFLLFLFTIGIQWFVLRDLNAGAVTSVHEMNSSIVVCFGDSHFFTKTTLDLTCSGVLHPLKNCSKCSYIC